MYFSSANLTGEIFAAVVIATDEAFVAGFVVTGEVFVANVVVADEAFLTSVVITGEVSVTGVVDTVEERAYLRWLCWCRLVPYGCGTPPLGSAHIGQPAYLKKGTD